MSIDFLLDTELDLQINENGDYTTTNTFETASVCGLFFEERDNRRRGHFAFVANEGSKLWTLEQSRLTQTKLNNARRFADSGLSFLTGDNLASNVTNTITRGNNGLNLRSEIVNNEIRIEREYEL